MNHLKSLRLWALHPCDKLSSWLRGENRGWRGQGSGRCLGGHRSSWTSSGKTPAPVDWLVDENTGCLFDLDDGRWSGTAGTFWKAVGRLLNTFETTGREKCKIVSRERELFRNISRSDHLATATTTKTPFILKDLLMRKVSQLKFITM